MADFTFEPQIIRFADFELDVGSGELRKSGGDPVLLAEQPFRILLTLIREQPERGNKTAAYSIGRLCHRSSFHPDDSASRLSLHCPQ
jgi:hypothetical protein